MNKLMILMVAAATSLMATAGTVTSFAYQGVLRDEVGNPIKAEQATITFRLYDAATDGNQLWESEMNLAIDTNGLFNAELTGGNLASVIATAENNGYSLYLGLTVKDSTGEILPRQKMIATPLAAYAQNVSKADADFTVDGTAIFSGEVRMKNTDSTFNAGNVDAGGNMKVTGTTLLKGATEVQNNMNVTGTMTVGGVACNLPIGAIIMWAGTANNIPDGWQLCDGSVWKGDDNRYIGTDATAKRVPNLSGRFIVGVGTNEGVTYSPGNTGGTNAVQLTVAELPSHSHKTTFNQNKVEFYGADHWVYGDTPGSSCGDDQYSASSASKTSATTGSDKAHENRPPYYALCYIIKVK